MMRLEGDEGISDESDVLHACSESARGEKPARSRQPKVLWRSILVARPLLLFSAGLPTSESSRSRV
eukprot:953332-Prymnesium_polylepis.2